MTTNLLFMPRYDLLWRRTAALVTLALLFLTPLVATATNRERPKLDDAAAVGAIVVDLSDGSVIADYDSRRALTPASILKSLSVAMALTAHGGDYRFATPVRLVGDRRGDTFHGTLVVEASGDPTIASRYFPQATLVDSIAANLSAMGINAIEGTVRVVERDGGYGPRPKWEIEDALEDYGAVVRDFNYADNLYRTRPTARPDSLFRADLGRALTIKESLPGIGADTLTVYTHLSPSLTEISRSLMHRSDNMMADAVLLSIAPDGTMSTALEREKAILDTLGIDLGPRRIYDGSGLIRTNIVTPAGMVRMLQTMASNADYVSTFPLAGREGTVKSMFKKTPLERRLAIKSGSMTGVRCYAGYLLSVDGHPTHALVVMVNNTLLPSAAQRQAIEDYLLRVLPY